MIPVIADPSDTEAQRIHQGLLAEGLDSAIINDVATINRIQQGVALAHVSLVDTGRNLPGLTSLIAFGGEDRAAPAVEVLQQGASEYLPQGAQMTKINQLVSRHISESTTDPNLVVTHSEQMYALMDIAQRVAQADISVLISGESGTGKEVFAQHIHRMSPRAQGPFIAVNCAAIPETMLEAVLFGHEKGAFTGASEKRLGKFELAHEGTLLLDEITEMPIGLQAKLLRVLQEREVERIGSNKPRKVSVRVLATSNRNLADAVREGLLREDLYYRLSVFPLVLPPLRERANEILPLAEHFLTKYDAAGKLRIGKQAASALLGYNWPGNVRELENCMQRAVVLCRGAEVEQQDLGLNIASDTRISIGNTLQEQVQDQADQVVLDALNANQGVRKSTAAQLGISERTLRYKLKQLRDRGLLA